MQSFLVITNKNNPKDLINTIKNENSSHYKVFFDEKVEKKYDFTISSAHNSSMFLDKKNANILLAVISYIPDMEQEEWASFYTNLCISDVLITDSFNKSKLDTISYPEKKIILIDGCHIDCNSPKLWKNDVTGKQMPLSRGYTPKLYNLDTSPSKIWERLTEYLTDKRKLNKSAKYKFFITNNIEEADFGLSMNPLGYGLTYYFSHLFRFSMYGNDDNSSLILDARCNHHLSKRIGPIVNIKGSAYTPQIKQELDVFLDTLSTLIEHTQKHDNLFRYQTNQSFLDRIFHQLNMTYQSS